MTTSPETSEEGRDSPPESSVDRLLDSIAAFCLWTGGILLVALIIIFGWLVFGRYVLNDTPTWVEQAALVMIVYITCLGAAAGVRYNTHLNIDFIREGLPAPINRAMHHLADLFVLMFGGFMAQQGWGLVMTNLERAIPMIGLSESWRAAPLVVCGVLMVLFSGANICKRIFAQEMKRN
ncbi:TRAP transporter small permease [Halomonas sp. TRM85114]|uniref:TRAP transporter small permease n=1 Tax=Halomonas jincaotanensis TaxID=2810616 RepID=UPI001BD562CD|nr:TRAP transporter small permease [Halomonas jincaotanensis]MBS9404368.1 TRAP transporter small permease [Halomonas jincaotanensis]